MSYPAYSGYGSCSHGKDGTRFVSDVTTWNQMKRKSTFSCILTAAYRMWYRLQCLQFCFAFVYINLVVSRETKGVYEKMLV